MASGHSCTTLVQGFTQDAMGAPRVVADGAPVDWPLEEEPVRVYCFLRLRGRSEPPWTGLLIGAAEVVPEPAAGAVEEEGADRDAARRAVEMARCARLAAQTSSWRRKERARRNVIGGFEAEIVGIESDRVL